MAHDEIPKHIKDKVWEDICHKVPYSMICEKWGIKSKGSITNIKDEYSAAEGVVPEKKPVSRREIKRRENISKSGITVHAYKRGEIIADGFLNAFEVIAYNAQHLMEVIDHSKTEADSLKEKQEEILEAFKKYVELPPEAKADVVIGIKVSIQKITDYFTRDMIRIKAVGEMRKQLETFLKMKQEIIDIRTIKNMMDAFFNAADELDDANYRKFRDKVIEHAPITSRLFAAAEQEKKGVGDDINTDNKEQ